MSLEATPERFKRSESRSSPLQTRLSQDHNRHKLNVKATFVAFGLMSYPEFGRINDMTSYIKGSSAAGPSLQVCGRGRLLSKLHRSLTTLPSPVIDSKLVLKFLENESVAPISPH